MSEVTLQISASGARIVSPGVASGTKTHFAAAAAASAVVLFSVAVEAHDVLRPVDRASGSAQVPAPVSAPRRYSQAFWNALASLTSRGVDGAHAGAANELWGMLADAHPSEPDLLLTEDGAVKFVWFGDRYYFDAAVLPGGRYEWFFRDDRAPAGSSRGSDDPESELPPDFWECARLAGAERAGR